MANEQADATKKSSGSKPKLPPDPRVEARKKKREARDAYARAQQERRDGIEKLNDDVDQHRRRMDRATSVERQAIERARVALTKAPAAAMAKIRKLRDQIQDQNNEHALASEDLRRARHDYQQVRDTYRELVEAKRIRIRKVDGREVAEVSEDDLLASDHLRAYLAASEALADSKSRLEKASTAIAKHTGQLERAESEAVRAGLAVMGAASAEPAGA